jgi:hypothetical protein
VLKWRGPATLYSSNVQQAITDGSMKAALDLFAEQGAAAALQHCWNNNAVSTFSWLDSRCCSGVAHNPHADSQPLGLMALVHDCADSTGNNAHALAPTIPCTSFIATVQTLAAIGEEETLLGVYLDSMTAKRTPDCSGATHAVDQ